MCWVRLRYLTLVQSSRTTTMLGLHFALHFALHRSTTMRLFAVFIIFDLLSWSRSNAFMISSMRRKSPAESSGTIMRGGARDSADIYENKHANYILGRRRLIQSLLISSTYKSIASHAADDNSAVLTMSKPHPISSNDVMIKAICDPTVESYRKGPNSIHIVGTAHISSVSSRLSRDAVRETKPEAVFLELDLQRVSRAFRDGQINQPTTILFFRGENKEGGGTVTLESAVLAPQQLGRRSTGIFRFFEKLTVQNPIQEMYDALEDRGITPGEEFITAVEEGVNHGSVIILGDRQMDITMRRLANALVFHTDPKRLVEADRVIISKMRERIPELAQMEQEAAKRQKKEISTEELTWFVEQMKTKETTVEIMNEMRKAVPEVYQALVGERDVYMAKGMDSLFSSFLSLASSPSSRSASRSSIQTMVAVIGLGHMSGVGNELVRLGWRKFNPNECL